MIDYGQGGVAGGYGGNDFSAQPRLVNGIKFKDPYGRNVEYVTRTRSLFHKTISFFYTNLLVTKIIRLNIIMNKEIAI